MIQKFLIFLKRFSWTRSFLSFLGRIIMTRPFLMFFIVFNQFKLFLKFFIVFGLSCLFATFGWINQGIAFVFIDIIIAIVMILKETKKNILSGKTLRERLGLFLLVIFLCVAPLFIAFIPALLLDISFTTSYQILSFGGCFNKINEKGVKQLN